MLTIFLVFLGLALLYAATYLYKTWLYPLYLQYFLNSQGIKGPPYIRKSTDMSMKSNSAPMELTHDIFPLVQPNYHAGLKLYGNNFFVWHGNLPELIVTDLEMIKTILSNKDGSFPKREISGPIEKLFGHGVLFSEGHKWSRLRKVSDLAFHAQNLKDMFPDVIGSVEAMLRTWKSYEGNEIEVFQQFSFLSSEVIAKTAFGSSYVDGQQIFQMLDRLTLVVLMSFQKARTPVIGKFFKTSEDIESDELEAGLRDAIMSMIKKREDSVKAGETDSYGSDFLGSLLKAHHDVDESIRISVNDIIDECKTFYFAGNETTTNALSWTVLLLAIHTDWQEKARKEVVELLGQENPRTDSMSKLETLGMVINESLRLYPPVIDIAKRVRRKTRLGEFTLPAGIEVNILPLAIQHSGEVWGEDAHLFKPERFAEGMAKATRNQMMAFLAFSFGPRKCVGMSFAMVEMKITLAMILQRYKFTLSPNYRHSPGVMLSVRPMQGAQIMLHPL